MPALVGCVLSYALLVSGVSGADAGAQGDICVPEKGTCALPGVVGVVATGGAAAIDLGVVDYATPVEVNCPTAVRGETSALFGGCDLPSFDFRYRVSRFPDSERPVGGVGPQRERRSAQHATVVQTGSPRDGGGVVSAGFAPLALYALARLPPPRQQRIQLENEGDAPTRVLEPLDRPPRA